MHEKIQQEATEAAASADRLVIPAQVFMPGVAAAVAAIAEVTTLA